MQPIILRAGSVSEALARGLSLLSSQAGVVKEDSRNGPVRVWDGPVVVHNTQPMRRVLFSPMRNANPFFHLFESLWMLGGRNDLPWLAQFNKQMASYSDDGGQTQPAAYGHRWRNYFGYDQLPVIIDELKKNPGTRRCVLGHWDAWGIHQLQDPDGGIVNHFGDLMGAVQGSADVPCNTQCYFTVRDGKLDMAVTCRSNDLLWGAHGANAVHFSILQEYIAASVGVGMGELIQFSWNYHLYENVLKHAPEAMAIDLYDTDRYTGRVNAVEISPIFSPATMEQFDRDLPLFLSAAGVNGDAATAAPVTHPFLRETAAPMLRAWRAYKRADLHLACQLAQSIEAIDWRAASYEWMRRHYDRLHNERKV